MNFLNKRYNIVKHPEYPTAHVPASAENAQSILQIHPSLDTMNQGFCEIVTIFFLESLNKTEQGYDWFGGLGTVKI